MTKGNFSGKLYNKNFVLLWQGQLISQLGSQASMIAMVFGLKHLTNSASLIGTLMMTLSIVGIVLGPIGGVVADLFSRKQIIVVTDLIGGFALVGLAITLLFGTLNTEIVVIAMFITEIIVTVTRIFFGPALMASIPSIVPQEKLEPANSLIRSSSTIVRLVGDGLGGILFRIVGGPVLFLIDGISYLLSGIAAAFITIPQNVSVEAKGRVNLKDMVSTLVFGIQYIWNRPELRILILINMLSTFFMAPISVIFPFYVEDLLHLSPDWFGFFMASMGIGALVGLWAVSFFKVQGRLKSRIMLTIILLQPFQWILLGLTSNQYAVLGILFLLGALSSYVGVQMMSLLQLTTPSELRGRIMGNFIMLTTGLAPLSLALTGFLIDLVNRQVNLLLIGSGLLVAIVQIPLIQSKAFIKFIAANTRDKQETLKEEMKMNELEASN